MNLILPSTYKSKLQSGDLSVSNAINRFVSENKEERFDAYCAIWTYKDASETRLFYGTKHLIGSRPCYEALYYLNVCLKMSYDIQIKNNPELGKLPAFTPSIVDPSPAINDLIDLLRVEQHKIDSIGLVFARGTDYKFTHGIEENLKSNELLETEANLVFGITTAMANIARLIKSFNNANQELKQIVNPEHRSLICPSSYA